MADQPNSSQGQQGMQSGYESPVFDLHAQSQAQPVAQSAQPQPTAPPPQPVASVVPDAGPTRFDSNAVPGSRVRIGQETIQIAPHPTTNRFPWAPVNNPTVPVYGTVVQQPTAPPPPPSQTPLPEPDLVLEPETGKPVLEEPAPPPPPPPRPVAPPPQPPKPEPVAVAPPPPPPQPVAPPPPPPAPAPEPEPVHEPAPILEPVPEPFKDPVLPPAPPPPRPKPEPSRYGARIYSEHTREVWRVIRPGGTLRGLYYMGLAAVIALVIYFIFVYGRSANLDQMPFVKELLSR